MTESELDAMAETIRRAVSLHIRRLRESTEPCPTCGTRVPKQQTSHG